MDMRDLLASVPADFVERCVAYYDGCDWIAFELPANVWTCLDVRACIDSAYVTNILNIDASLDITADTLSVDPVWINSIVNVVWNAPNLTVGDTTVELTDFLGDLSITFQDLNYNSFNTAGNYEIFIIGLDGLRFIDNGVDTLQIGLPIPPAEYFSDSGNTTPPQLPGAYLPFNFRLVLTRDSEQHTSYRAVPQCCIHVLEFLNGQLTVDGGTSHVDLSSINTDNQEFSLVGDDLHLTTCVGTTLGQCVAGPDSVVSLEGANQHSLSIMGHNTLMLLDSSGNINTAIDLMNIGPHDLSFNNTTNELSILNDSSAVMSTVDLSGVNNQTLSWVNGGLHISGDEGCCGLRRVQWRKPVHFCSDVLACICQARFTRAEWEDLGLVDPSLAGEGIIAPANWTVANGLLPQRWVDRGRAQPTQYPPGHRVWPLWDIATVYLEGQIVQRNDQAWVMDTDTHIAGEEPGVSGKWITYITAWDRFLDASPTMCEMLNWIGDVVGGHITSNHYVRTEGDSIVNDNSTGDIYNDNINNTYGGDTFYGDNYGGNTNIIGDQITATSDLIEKTKYWARIYATTNRFVRSRHTDNDDGGANARWFFPNMDGGDGWESATTSLSPVIRMIEPTNFIISHANRLEFANGDTFDISDPLKYFSGPGAASANNALADSNGMCSEFGSNTITIPFTGMYTISLNAEVQVDHNVHAFRVAILRWNPTSNLVTPVVDTKFGGDTSVGSHSVNDIAYPTTKQYTCSGSKMIDLEVGDILFLGIRIDPVTNRPIDIPQRWLNDEAGSAPEHPYRATINRSHVAGVPKYPGSPGSFGMRQSMSASHLLGISPQYETVMATSGSLNLTWPAPGAPDLVNPYYRDAVSGTSGSLAYGYNLAYVGMDNGFHQDDGVVWLLGPSNIVYPTGSGGSDEPQGGSMVTAVYMNKTYAVAP